MERADATATASAASAWRRAQRQAEDAESGNDRCGGTTRGERRFCFLPNDAMACETASTDAAQSHATATPRAREVRARARVCCCGPPWAPFVYTDGPRRADRGLALREAGHEARWSRRVNCAPEAAEGNLA